MGRLSGYLYRDVTKRLKLFGFAFDRQAAGSHEIWYQHSGNRYTTTRTTPVTCQREPFAPSCAK